MFCTIVLGTGREGRVCVIACLVLLLWMSVIVCDDGCEMVALVWRPLADYAGEMGMGMGMGTDRRGGVQMVEGVVGRGSGWMEEYLS